MYSNSKSVPKAIQECLTIIERLDALEISLYLRQHPITSDFIDNIEQFLCPLLKILNTADIHIVSLVYEQIHAHNEWYSKEKLLESAIAENHLHLCENIITLGIDFNSRPARCNGSVEQCVLLNRLEALELVLRHGADPNGIVNGYTPLDLAMMMPQEKMQELLRDHGAVTKMYDKIKPHMPK